ncbi:MAG TPA: UDP-3-O-(3-hydroxymyristoyl)glucosamine N-acyltransferase [Bacteroidales bacterium]|nr:UDP-3-O-(3-hydroxymyristoyl)glucosamine N-acyltransferase [Bacteroidales bacterium]
MKFTARIIADFTKGEIIGNPDEVVTGISKIEEGKKGTLAFLANPKYEKYLYNTEASVVLINKDFLVNDNLNCTIIKVNNAYDAFTSLLELYSKQIPEKKGIEQPCFVDPTAKIGENTYIGAFAYVGANVEIGNNVKIYPHAYIGESTIINNNTIIYSGVKIYHGCLIGSDCIIHSGVIIGADGFGFVQQPDQQYRKIPQVGNVIIEDWVEIGSNVTIDRATMGSTIIRRGAKFDNLIQIGHNVEIGENTVIVSQAGVAGSTKVGRNCMIGGQVGLAGHLKIGDNVKIGAQSGVSNNLKDNETVLGSPALNVSKQIKAMIVYKSLPEMSKKIAELEKELKLLKDKM